MDQLEYVDSLIAKDKRKKLDNPPGLYVSYLRDNVAPPSDFSSSQKTKLHYRELKDAEPTRKARLEIEYGDYCDVEAKRFTEALPAEEYQALLEEQRCLVRDVFRSKTPEQLDEWAHRSVLAALQNSGRVQLLSFDEFCRCQTVPA